MFEGSLDSTSEPHIKSAPRDDNPANAFWKVECSTARASRSNGSRESKTASLSCPPQFPTLGESVIWHKHNAHSVVGLAFSIRELEFSSIVWDSYGPVESLWRVSVIFRFETTDSRVTAN
jgi:hypothetical protein